MALSAASTPFHDNAHVGSLTAPQHVRYIMKSSLCPGWVPMATEIHLLKG